MRPVVYTDMADPGLHRYFTDFNYTAWGLYQRQHYQFPSERDAYERWRDRGIIEPPTDWIATVVDPAVSAGKSIGRVHITRDTTPEAEEATCSDYLFFATERYRYSAAAGEDVRLLTPDPEAWPYDVCTPDLDEPDLWLFDSSTLILLHYTGDGVFKEAVVHTAQTYPSAIVRACAVRDAARHVAVALS